MRAVIQRVSNASVKVDGKTVGAIEKGYLILLGVGQNDTKQDADKIAEKISRLRIFSDENDKINLSIKDVDGEILVVSQFTLYADCKHGNRPSFINAGKPEKAESLYEYFVEQCRKYVPKVEKGLFGADMKVELLNDGPFTILINCDNGIIS